MAEVEGLRPQNGGSNDAARRTWLARCPPDLPARPRPGDPLEKFKAFILAAYEDGRWCVGWDGGHFARPAGGRQ